MKAALWIGNSHGSAGVAVVAAFESNDPVAPKNAAIAPILQRHFQCDFDGDRSGFAEKHTIEIARTKQAAEPASQGQSLFVHQPAEHHMRHGLELMLHRGADVRMIVAVARRPPRGDPIDQLASIGQYDAAAAGRLDRKRKRHRFHLCIG
jgi:hypothetical protein